MTRFYSVQKCDTRGGWVSVGVFSKKEKPCNDYAKEYARNTHFSTRTIRMPHGFQPSDEDKIL